MLCGGDPKLMVGERIEEGGRKYEGKTIGMR